MTSLHRMVVPTGAAVCCAAALLACTEDVAAPVVQTSTAISGSASSSLGASGTGSAASSGAQGAVSGVSSIAGTGSIAAAGAMAAAGSLAAFSGDFAATGTVADSGTVFDASLQASGASDGGLPCDIGALFVNRCQSCHGVIPVLPAPQSLVTVADLTAPALPDPAVTNAVESLDRMQDTVAPMPPFPAPPATEAEVQALKNWISAGYPTPGCAALDAGTSVQDAAVEAASYAGPLICSSGQTYGGGNGPGMRPGDPCNTCHGFSIAGTVYQSEHEQSSCDGTSANAMVVITDGLGVITTIPLSANGNFYTSEYVAAPFQAKVVYQGRENIMMTPQATGSCNLCHTPMGANGAPGRIMLP